MLLLVGYVCALDVIIDKKNNDISLEHIFEKDDEKKCQVGGVGGEGFNRRTISIRDLD